MPRLVEGGPAHLSGEIKVGDRVMGIDGKSLYTKGDGYQRVVLFVECVLYSFDSHQRRWPSKVSILKSIYREIFGQGSKVLYILIFTK